MFVVIKPYFQGFTAQLFSSLHQLGVGTASPELRAVKHHGQFANCCMNKTCILLSLCFLLMPPTSFLFFPSCVKLLAKAIDSQCSMISHDCAPPAAQALAPSLPSCFGGRDFSSQATLCWWAPSFPASGSGGSPCLRAWTWWQRLCSREDHSLSQGAFAVGSTELPASAVR